MEFLRFGSSIPGGYWGCCAVCIIQDFNQEPDTKASIQLVSGDGGGGLMWKNQLAFAGPTYADIFKARIRIGTFSTNDMPDHAFFAILTAYQVNSVIGKKWLALLKAEGFEFVRTQSNSVYTGAAVPAVGGADTGGAHENHIFALFRNIQGSRVKDPLTPPKAWTDLPEVCPEAWQKISAEERLALANAQRDFGRARWAETSPTKLVTEKDLVAAGAPVVLAGLRSSFPPQTKEQREKIQAAKAAIAKPAVDPFNTGAMKIATVKVKN